MRFLFFYLLFFKLGISFGQSEQLQKILSKEYQFTMISKDDNIPNFDPSKDSLTELIVLLHHKIKPENIKKHFLWSEHDLSKRIDILLKSNYIKKDTKDNFIPNVFVCSIYEAKDIKTNANDIVVETVNSIQAFLPKVKQQISNINSFANYNFKEVSFLVLSNVLLDNWQIENVENVLLKAKRTQRHGKNYYASFLEKNKDSKQDALGIYGNQFEDTLDFSICRYGNYRNTKKAIIKNKTIKSQFIKNPKSVKYLIINALDNSKIQTIADDYKPFLISILNKHKPKIVTEYSNSIYSTEISFEEYFIWFYHIYYSAVTDELIKRKIIRLPKEKNSHYILELN